MGVHSTWSIVVVVVVVVVVADVVVFSLRYSEVGVHSTCSIVVVVVVVVVADVVVFSSRYSEVGVRSTRSVSWQEFRYNNITVGCNDRRFETVHC